MQKLLFFFAFFICLLTFTPRIFAHAGVGPPFLQINGKYAQTYQYYLGNSPLTLPWDIAPDRGYVINKPIDFTIDTKAMQIPQVIINGSIFRWTFSGTNRQYYYGTHVVHSYTAPGSYFISLEVKSADQQNFILIDSVQIDVLPNSAYILPQANISVVTSNMDPNLPLLFKGSTKTNPGVKIVKQIWDFGDGQISHSQNAIHQYKYLSGYKSDIAIYQVTDSNGFISNAGVKIDNTNGKLVFSDQNGHTNIIPVSTDFAKEAKALQDSQSVPPWLVGIGVIVLLLGSALVIQLAMKR